MQAEVCKTSLRRLDSSPNLPVPFDAPPVAAPPTESPAPVYVRIASEVVVLETAPRC